MEREHGLAQYCERQLPVQPRCCLWIVVHEHHTGEHRVSSQGREFHLLPPACLRTCSTHRVVADNATGGIVGFSTAAGRSFWITIS